MGTNSKPTKPKVRDGLKHRGGGGGGGGTKNIDAVLLHPPQWERAQEEKKTTKLQSDTAELLMNKTGQLGQEQQGWRQSQTGEASRADASQRVPWEVRM